MKQKVRVWDIPTRLFHWSLVLSIGFMWFSAEQGGDWLAWHLRCGLFILALLVFRVCWGLWGSDTSRFAQFVKPTQIGRYLSGKLSENEQQLLIKLIAHQGKIISRTELALALGETDTYLAGRALDIAISRLRKKLVQLSGQAEELLVTYRNQGYLLVQEWPEAGIKEGTAR